MKKAINSILVILFLFVSLGFSTKTANAATTLAVYSTRKPGIYYTDTYISVYLYSNVSLTSFPYGYIVYTTNGTNPSATVDYLGNLRITNGYKYSGPINLSSTKTVKAIALKKLFYTSPVTSFKFEVYSPTKLIAAAKVKHSGFYWNNTTYFPWTLKYTAQDGRVGSFNKTYTGITLGTVNCTWYTYAKSKFYSKPVLFTTAGGLDGKYWYSKIVATTKQVKYAGNNGLEALISANSNRPLYNVIVSFERNGTKTNGHVMMIDAIINGKIYFSDNSKPGVWRGPYSVSEFKNLYYSYNGLILGVVHQK